MTLAIYCTLVFYPITVKYLQHDRHVSMLSAAKIRIDLSLIDHVLQHFRSKKLPFHRTKLNAFCTPLKKLELHQPISQKPFEILKKFKHI